MQDKIWLRRISCLFYVLPEEDEVLGWPGIPVLPFRGLTGFGFTTGGALPPLVLLSLPLPRVTFCFSSSKTSGGGGGSSTSASSWESPEGGGGGISSIEVDKSRDVGAESKSTNTSWSDVCEVGRGNTLAESDSWDEVLGVADLGGTGGGVDEELFEGSGDCGEVLLSCSWLTAALSLPLGLRWEGNGGRGGGGGGGGGGGWASTLGGEGGGFCAGSEGEEGGGFCARSVGGEGGGGGGDSARVFLDRFDELLLLLSPFRSFSCSSLTLSVGWLGSSCCFLENDLRGGGGGSSTSLGCDSNCTCSTCSVVGLSSSFSSSTVCIPMFSMLKVLLSSVLGVSPPVLCTEGGSGEMGGPAVLWKK